MSDELVVTLTEFEGMGQGVPPRMQRMLVALFEGWARAGELAIALREGEAALQSITRDVETARAAKATTDERERVEQGIVVAQRSAEIEALQRTKTNLLADCELLRTEKESLVQHNAEARASIESTHQALSAAAAGLRTQAR